MANRVAKHHESLSIVLVSSPVISEQLRVVKATWFPVLSLYLKAVISKETCNVGGWKCGDPFFFLFWSIWKLLRKRELQSSEQFANASHDIWASFLVVKPFLLHVLTNPLILSNCSSEAVSIYYNYNQAFADKHRHFK